MNVIVCNCPFYVHMEEVLIVDEWSGLADMLANLIEKYASDLDIENLPDITVDNHVEEKNKATKDWQDVSC